MKQKSRENWIDFLKLIAIVIVVMNHAGFTVPGVSFWGGMFFVPVFFVLSGYTYQMRKEPLRRTAAKKAGRLLVPYFTANACLFLVFFFKDVIIGRSKGAGEAMQSLFGIFYARNQFFTYKHAALFAAVNRKNDVLMTNLNSPTWFLPALFLTILLYEAAGRILKQDTRKMWLLASVLQLVSILYHYISPVLLMWSIDAVSFFFFFFLAGNMLKKYHLLEWIDSRKWTLLAALAVLIPSAVYNGSANFSIGMYGKSVVLALLNALLSSSLMMYLLWKIRNHIPELFGMAGRQTLVILCYHLFVLALLEAVAPGVPVFVRILITVILLAAIGAGKTVVLQKWKGKRRQEHNAAEIEGKEKQECKGIRR